MNRETLLEELNRLLDLGEPLLTLFPKKYTYAWFLQTPDNISPKMRFYANDVARRSWNRKRYQGFRQQDTTGSLAERVKDCEVGLLGWRSIGVLK